MKENFVNPRLPAYLSGVISTTVTSGNQDMWQLCWFQTLICVYHGSSPTNQGSKQNIIDFEPWKPQKEEPWYTQMSQRKNAPRIGLVRSTHINKIAMYPMWCPDGVVDITPDKYAGRRGFKSCSGPNEFFFHFRDVRWKQLVSDLHLYHLVLIFM